MSLLLNCGVSLDAQNVVVKLVDLVIQSIMLVQIMEYGMPLAFVAVFTGVIVCNALATAIVLESSLSRPALTVILLDTM